MVVEQGVINGCCPVENKHQTEECSCAKLHSDQNKYFVSINSNDIMIRLILTTSNIDTVIWNIELVFGLTLELTVGLTRDDGDGGGD